MKKLKNSKIAAIRTENNLLPYAQAKRKKHDASMVETPAAWVFSNINGTYYPYQVI